MDIVERLRTEMLPPAREAADEIERLRAALQGIMDHIDSSGDMLPPILYDAAKAALSARQ